MTALRATADRSAMGWRVTGAKAPLPWPGLPMTPGEERVLAPGSGRGGWDLDVAGLPERHGLCVTVSGNWRSAATTWFGAPTGARSTGS
ncbi:hypothetical protein WME91_56135 [Sorangium sp. So ce269]